jgi:hypothetical protein
VFYPTGGRRPPEDRFRPSGKKNPDKRSAILKKCQNRKKKQDALFDYYFRLLEKCLLPNFELFYQ